MCWMQKSLFKFGFKYRNHHKLVVYRHYIVYFINESKHIEDIAPDIRKSMVVDNFEADVVFVIDDMKFPAHKRILKITNEQFYIQNIEPHEGSKEIEIENVDPRGFQQFLRFCHFGDLDLNHLNMMQSYDVAQTYNHANLLALCTNFISDNVVVHNVLEILNWNLLHQNYQIMRRCRGFFIENAVEILKSTEQFRKIDKKLLKTILSWEVLNCSEKTLFNKTVEWAEEKCFQSQVEATIESKKDMLEDILYLIRLEISPNLEVLNDFPTSPRTNRFNKRRFDNLHIRDEIEQTWEEIPAANENTICYGFSIILSNPDSKRDTNEEFLMTLESENDLLLQKHFVIKTVDFLAVKDFVFEDPIVMEKHKRHILKVKFVEPHRRRCMEKDDFHDSVRILRLYD